MRTKPKIISIEIIQYELTLQRIFPPDFGEMRAISEGYLNSYFIL
jgi:hypothetical protein